MPSAEQHESTRQHALDAYRIVDSLPEGTYDDIVRLASTLCGTPIALLSLLDHDRQWFKARIGLSETETPRDVAVCNHAVRTPGELMEIHDLSADARFADFPYVAGGPQARFYAGMPLLTPNGQAIGTVCVLDDKPRTLTAGQRDALAALSRMTMALLNGRLRERNLERAAALAAAAPLYATPPAMRDGYTLAIVEVPNPVGLVDRVGKDKADAMLQRLQYAMERCLQGNPDDIVHRASIGNEFTVVLHGCARPASLQRLQACLADYRTESEHPVLLGSAEASHGGEAMEEVFMRADAQLGQARHALRTR